MEILEIDNKIKEKGGNLYLVGGVVHNELLGKEIQDEYYCVTGLTLKEILQKIDGNTIKEKYKIKDEKQIGELLRNKRIELIKSIENKNKVI